MKRIYTTIGMLFLLAGCGGVPTQSYHYQQPQNSAELEMAAWNYAISQIDEKCPKVPFPAEKALEVNDCRERIKREIVGPVAIAPHLFAQLLLSEREIAIKYKNNEIDKDMANVELEKARLIYANAVAEKAERDFAREQLLNSQRDAVAAQQRQAMREFGAALLNPPRPQSAQNIGPVHTTCRDNGFGTVRCTTY